MNDIACVYWIHSPDQTDILTQGYIGYTSKSIEHRVKSHKCNYKRFLSRGNKGGCILLYKNIKNLGGWQNIKIDVLCQSSLDYALILEEKLRPVPNLGWNIRVGGDKGVMFKRNVSEETKLKLSKIRDTWVMSKESRTKLSEERKGEGNPMYGTAPWNMVNACKNSWSKADQIYKCWELQKFAVKKMSKIFPELNYWSIDTIIRKFKDGWIPNKDDQWLYFKEIYNET